jgi:uncharacterized protein
MNINNVHFFSIKDRYFAYDISGTFCFEVDQIALTVLPEILAGTKDGIVEKYRHIYSSDQIRESVQESKEVVDKILSNTKPERRHDCLQDKISGISLHVSHDCNMNCSYCYADAGTFGGNQMLMTSEVMRKAIDFTFAGSGNTEEVRIAFFGGEPLLNFGLINDAVSYSKDRAAKYGKMINFGMTTNATLLTKKIIDFLVKENFSMLFSIDGPSIIHNKMRKFKGGKGSHSQVLRNIKEYMRLGSNGFTVRGTFTRSTPNFSEQVVFLNEQGFRSISVEPAQLHESNPLSIYSGGMLLRAKSEYDKLASIYIEMLVKDKPISFFHFDHYLRKMIQPSRQGFCSHYPRWQDFPLF